MPEPHQIKRINVALTGLCTTLVILLSGCTITDNPEWETFKKHRHASMEQAINDIPRMLYLDGSQLGTNFETIATNAAKDAQTTGETLTTLPGKLQEDWTEDITNLRGTFERVKSTTHTDFTTLQDDFIRFWMNLY